MSDVFTGQVTAGEAASGKAVAGDTSTRQAPGSAAPPLVTA